ncbi:hypothetical protein [Pseudoalteromonas phage J2-1_QLiu-2017]|nr:hypothetical protein [Pseudoalteromonas phage J2-1_QLiu-2017]
MSNEIQFKNYEDYIELLPSQYRDSEKLQKLLSIFLNILQQPSDALQELDRQSTNYNEAEGYQLDIIGELVGAKREGRNDSEYVDYIKFILSKNVGSGTTNDIIQYLAVMTETDYARVFEHYPAAVIAETAGTVTSGVLRSVDSIAVGGVSILGISNTLYPRMVRFVDTPFASGNLELDPDVTEIAYEMGQAVAEMNPAIPDTNSDQIECIYADASVILTDKIPDYLYGSILPENTNEAITAPIEERLGVMPELYDTSKRG